MRSGHSPAALLLLGALALATCCSRSAKHPDVFWHGELWDGMNRMVFALQDLGFQIESVDTEAGTILAVSAQVAGKKDIPHAGRLGETYSVLVKFPEDPNLPVTISAAPNQGGAADASKMRKIASEISKRFAWYGGNRTEAKWQAPSD